MLRCPTDTVLYSALLGLNLNLLAAYSDRQAWEADADTILGALSSSVTTLGRANSFLFLTCIATNRLLPSIPTSETGININRYRTTHHSRNDSSQPSPRFAPKASSSHPPALRFPLYGRSRRCIAAFRNGCRRRTWWTRDPLAHHTERRTTRHHSPRVRLCRRE